MSNGLILLSDLHLLIDQPKGRIDNAPEAAKKKLEYILSVAEDNDYIINQAGDFFDVPRNWNILTTYGAIIKEHDIKMHSIFGQHDMYMYSEKLKQATSMGVLGLFDLLEPLNKEGTTQEVNGKYVIVYGCNYGENIPIPRVVKGVKNILVIHRMIVPFKLYSKQDDYIYAPDFLKQHKEYDIILTGDCHRKFLFEDKGRFICNTGCIMRHIADEYNLTYEPGFYGYDGEELEWISIPHEPADKVLSREHIEEKNKREKALDEFVSNVNSSDSEISNLSFVDNLIDFTQKNKISTEVKDILAETIDEEIKWKKKI
jgi:hypothetical protein